MSDLVAYGLGLDSGISAYGLDEVMTIRRPARESQRQEGHGDGGWRVGEQADRSPQFPILTS